MFQVAYSSSIAMLVLLLTSSGCAKKAFDLVPVSGTLKYTDGTVPQGEVRTVRFEPTPSPEGGRVSPRPATADIQSDGSFKLMTFKPGDGALEGSYKVVLLIWKTYRGREPVLSDIYGKQETTPLGIVTVKGGTKNHVDLVVDKRSPSR